MSPNQQDRTEGTSTARVLLVDDEQVVHASVCKVLRGQGYLVHGVFTAEEGLELLEQGDFDLVVTDLMMPGMNGIAMLQAMQHMGIRVPVIMITGYPTIRTAVQAMRLGACDYIAKPFTRKELLGPVSRALQRPQDGGPAAAGEGGAPSRAALVPGTTVYLANHAWARFDQDGTFLVGVEQSFLQAAGGVVAAHSPVAGEIVEQGVVGLRLVNQAGEVHGVAMPLTGKVVAVNGEVLETPDAITSDTWLVRLLPSHLDNELGDLSAR